jgi:CBS domain-containing protein
MKLQAVMTKDVKTCAPADTVAAAARLMGEGDFGFLPVIGARNRVVGVVTDRDVCLSIAHDVRAPADIPVRDAMTRKVFTCFDTDDPHVVLAIMKKRHVRRVPVVNRAGMLQGLVSMDDLILNVADREVDLGPTEIVAALKEICASRWPEPAAV